MGANNSDESMCLDSLITNSRKLEYTHNIPALPRVIIPPLLPGSDGFSHRLRGIESGYDQEDLSFLKVINLSSNDRPASQCAWEYSRRRVAQMVLPYLYLGPIAAARDKDFLERECMTMLLAVRYRHGQSSKLMAGAAQAAIDLGIVYECVDVQSSFDVVGSFSKSVDLINKHMSSVYSASISRDGSQPSIGKVLVFCESGNDLSAAIVVSYLMSMLEGINHIRAIQLCQARRFSAHFNEPTKVALQSYWDILCARRDVTESSAHYRVSESQVYEASRRSDRSLSSSRGKRALSDGTRNGDGMDCFADVADAVRFEGRSVQPFREDANS